MSEQHSSLATRHYAKNQSLLTNKMVANMRQNADASTSSPGKRRENSSRQSWVKHPGPLCRDSMSKFQDTDVSKDNSSAHKQRVGMTDSPEIHVMRPAGAHMRLHLQTAAQTTGAMKPTGVSMESSSRNESRAGTRHPTDAPSGRNQQVLQPIKVPISRRISNVTESNNKVAMNTLKSGSPVQSVIGQHPNVTAKAHDGSRFHSTSQVTDQSAVAAMRNASGSQLHQVREHSKRGSTFEPSEKDVTAEMKNFENYSKANGAYQSTAGSSLGYDAAAQERLTGYPNPQLYDQYYINKYSFPKGLQAIYKGDDERR